MQWESNHNTAEIVSPLFNQSKPPPPSYFTRYTPWSLLSEIVSIGLVCVMFMSAVHVRAKWWPTCANVVANRKQPCNRQRLNSTNSKVRILIWFLIDLKINWLSFCKFFVNHLTRILIRLYFGLFISSIEFCIKAHIVGCPLCASKCLYVSHTFVRQKYPAGIIRTTRRLAGVTDRAVPILSSKY